MPEPLLSCRGVTLAYDKVQVLFGVDLDVHEGEIVALLGTNGAGKSTLLRAISGLAAPSGGTIRYAGEDLTGGDPEAAVRRGIVQVPGGRSTFPTLSVAENLRVASWMVRKDPKRAAAAVQEALDRFPALGRKLALPAGNLSGGEQQMLGLGMAFVADPRLLLIDELSLGLAPAIVEQLLEIVRAVHAQGTTLVLVEQSVNVALTVAQRAVFLEKGEVRFEGPTADLLDRGDVLRSVFLEGAGTSLGGPALERRPAPAPAAGGAPAIEARDLAVAFGGVRAVDGCSFAVAPAEVVALIGPNGAGKTTVFDLLSGFVPPTSGQVLLDGVDVTAWRPDRRAVAGLGRSFQDARIFASMSVAENVALALERHLEVRDHVAAMLRLPDVQDEERRVAERVDELVELLGLGAFRSKLVGELSTGSRRIVDLAMALAHAPSVLLLDEPSSGIAQREAEALAPLLLRIRDQLGCALLVVEHDMPLVTSIADRIVALESGRPIAQGPPDEVLRHPRVVAAYLGTDERVVNRSGALRRPGPVGRSGRPVRRRERPLRAR